MNGVPLSLAARALLVAAVVLALPTAFFALRGGPAAAEVPHAPRWVRLQDPEA